MRFKRNFYIYIVLIVLFLPVSSLFAQLHPIQFYKDTLANGLQVIYHVDKTAPLVVTVMHYRVGSHDEDTNQTGYAHFFEHLMFEATDDIPRAKLDKYIEEAGGTLNASTSFDQTVYFFKVPANEIKLPLWAESERMRKLHVDTIGVETQRGVVLEEMKQRLDNTTYGQFLPKMCARLFAGSSYSWPVIGSSENIKAATIDDFRKFYNTYYQPNNATLVIAGDFDFFTVKDYVKSYFGIYPKANEPVRNFKPIPPITKPYREEITDIKAQLPAVMICYRGPSLTDSTYYAFQLLSKILSHGESSRLYRRLIDKEQVASQANVSGLFLQYSGAIYLQGIALPGKNINDVEESFLNEIEKLLQEGITENELQKAKNITESEFINDRKNVLGKAQALARYNSYYGKPELINTELENYMKVTVSDVMNVAKMYFGTKNTVTLTFLPKKK